MSGQRSLNVLADVLFEKRERVRVEPDGVYPMAGVLGFGRGLLLRDSVKGLGISADHLFRIRTGHIIYSRLKAFEGAFALVPLAGEGRFVSNEFPTFEVDRARVYPEFIELLLQRPAAWQELSSGSQGIGARRERLQPADFLEFEVELPSLEAQRRILDAIGAVQGAAAAARDEASAAQRLARVLYREATESGATRSVLFDDFASLEIDQIVVDKEAEYRVAGVAIAGGGLFWRPTLRGAGTRYTKLHRLSTGVLVYRKLTAWEGPITVVPEEFDGAVVSPEFPTMKLDEQVVCLEFMTFLCRLPAVHMEMRARSAGTAERRNRLKPEDLLQVPIELPSRDLQQQIGALARLSTELMSEAIAHDTLTLAMREDYLTDAL